ncbi:peptide chain release factor N(5)-glutamine methyltransferase [Stenotrophomonas sp. STM01]|nr:peptide chain release factor N(5)-glutamine methyltransferase [Stenotrophomonas sp. STM01]
MPTEVGRPERGDYPRRPENIPRRGSEVSTVNVAELLREAAGRLSGADARHEAEQLLLHVLGVERAWLFAHATDAVDPDARQRFELLVTRRAEGHPLAYLVGRRGFWTLDLQVNTATLIPRPETELLVEQALARLPDDDMVRVADMGTGSGAVALSIASERPLATVMATDVLGPALAVAVKNAQAHGLENVWFRRGHWFVALGADRFDMIVSNPPYIAAGDPHLTQGDLRFEPPPALASGADGLDAIREIVAGAPEHLVPGGWLLLEHGWDQGEAIRALLEQAGFVDAQTVQDLEQRDRVTLGRLPA